MLRQYSNIDQILSSKESLNARRLDSVDYDLLTYPDYRISYNSQLNSTTSQKVEFHVYSNDTWITGNHEIMASNVSPNIRDTETNDFIIFPFALILILINV